MHPPDLDMIIGGGRIGALSGERSAVINPATQETRVTGSAGRYARHWACAGGRPLTAAAPGTQLPHVALWQPRQCLAAPVSGWLVCDLV